MGIIIGSCVPEPEQDSSYRIRRVLYGELLPYDLQGTGPVRLSCVRARACCHKLVMVAALLRFQMQREESIGHVGALDGCYNTVTERRDWMDSCPASHWAEIDYNWQVFSIFPQFLRVFGCMVRQPKPWPHNSTSYPVHYSVVLSFEFRHSHGHYLKYDIHKLSKPGHFRWL